MSKINELPKGKIKKNGQFYTSVLSGLSAGETVWDDAKTANGLETN